MTIEALGAFCVCGVSLSPDKGEGDACDTVLAELRRVGISPARLALKVCKKSVDARKKRDVRVVYSVAVEAQAPISADKLARLKYRVTPVSDGRPEITYGSEIAKHPPLVVGMGPAGMLCALMLAENGYRPTLIDRGDGIAERCRRTEVFFNTGELDVESNIQFGAGGAGTFSDGKLVTRVGDARLSYVLEKFCEFGAPRDILTEAKPHIGTDLLVGIVDKMLSRIEELGGRVVYRCRLTEIKRDADGLRAVTTTGEIPCSSIVLATGHSARDIYSYLLHEGFAVEPKPFSVGVRIEHLQENIDKAMYGDFAGHPNLGHGEYHLSDTSTGRGVYTFCMCPGGEVVGASSEAGGVVVNGMSRNARAGRNANSAVLVSVRPEDTGGTPESNIEFQKRLERLAFESAGSDYYAPYSTVGDFLGGTHGSEPTSVLPTYRGGKVRSVSLDGLLPHFVCEELRLGLNSFEKRIQGFADGSAILTGVETRSSAPVRILRGESLCAVGNDGIYPCGEGAGYAGGISSAAIDGIKVALAIMKRFKAH